jgi:hypothetical protein
LAQEEFTESVFDAGHRALQSIDPSAFLVWPRILRRLALQDREVTGIHWHVPHRKCYVVARERLLQFVAPDELWLTSSQSIPDRVILISRPDRDDLVDATPEALESYLWRLLFHARVHVHLDRLIETKQLTVSTVRARIDQIGQSEFDEIRSVLQREHLLFPDPKEIDVYAEFVAVYAELQQFSPKWRRSYFPSIHDFTSIDATVAQDLDSADLFQKTRLPLAPLPEFVELAGQAELQAAAIAEERALDRVPKSERIPPGSRWAERNIERLVQQAEKQAAKGNSVRAAVLQTQACQFATPEHEERLMQLADTELAWLTKRLQAAVGFDEADAEAWKVSLTALVRNSLNGFWNNDARLLYDLQKVCVDHEREVSVISLMGWICSFGRRPIKRPLPNQREVLMSKHLRSATARLPTTALTSTERKALSRLLNAAARSAEEQLRKRLRPLLSEALVRVGLNPLNVPEQVARQKLIEEMSDAIVRRGFLTIGNLRDTMSRNNLKLFDLETVGQIISGDQLLRADRQLSELLDGVYQPGEFYMRWLQRLSSLAFGTKIGRFFTQFIAIPFGASVIILEGLDHLLHAIIGVFTKATPATYEVAEGSVAAAHAATHEMHHPIVMTYPIFFSLGFFLLALIHVRLFRKAIVEILRLTWKTIRTVAYDSPRWLLKLPLVQALLRSTPAVLFRRYLLLPLVSSAFVAALSLSWIVTWKQWWYVNGGIWLILCIVLNSRLGRDFEELSSEWVMRVVHKVGVRFFLSLFEFVWELFKRLLEFIERVLYAVDEWLRFKSGESQLTLIFKAILGIGWGAVTFVVRFWVNLLIEPQINPIKHFPVVTVSHKIILPMQPLLTSTLEVRFGLSAGWSNTFAAVAVFFAPGIFGFLVWELKENWRLFAANRAGRLLPVLIGSHGETLIRLMKPGFHSGTLPKLYSKLRRSERKAHLPRWKNAKAVYRDRLHHVEEDVRHFIERDLVALLYESRGWGGVRLELGHVEAASNSLKIEIQCPTLSTDNLWLLFEEQSGWLVASIMRPGWLIHLNEAQLTVIKLALAGIYKMGGVDLIREQICACFNQRPLHYDISDQGLVVWPDRNYAEEVRYPLSDRRIISPRPRRVAREHQLLDLDARALMYNLNPISWKRWVEAWTAESEGHVIPALFPIEIQLLPPDALRKEPLRLD